MAERSKRIMMYDENKAKQINPETLKLFQKYQIDMSIRDLSPYFIMIDLNASSDVFISIIRYGTGTKFTSEKGLVKWVT